MVVQGDLVAIQKLNCKSLQITDGKLLLDLIQVDVSADRHLFFQSSSFPQFFSNRVGYIFYQCLCFSVVQLSQEVLTNLHQFFSICRHMGADERYDLLFLIAQGTLLWQPILGPILQNLLTNLHLSFCCSKTYRRSQRR